ncbi:hypothetical protein HZS_2434, partial [Henneguya salminicola]
MNYIYFLFLFWLAFYSLLIPFLYNFIASFLLQFGFGIQPNNDKIFLPKYQNLDDEMNLSKIIRSPIALYLDVEVIVTKEAIKVLKDYDINYHLYFSHVFAEISLIFFLHNFHFSVRKMEFWSDQNRVNQSNILDATAYQTYFKTSSPFDAYIVFTDLHEHHFNGYGVMNSVCEHRALSLVDIGERRKFNARRVAETVAHELGHIMGFDHSMNRSDCSCGIEDKKKCIMYGQNFR